MSGEKPESLAAAEPYVRTFEATVRSVDGREVTLDRTYFYPEGGGQPPDEGTLGGVDVVDVQKREGVTVHTLADPPGFDAGDTVEGHVDDEFRTYSMRAHTASHVVYGAWRQLFDDHGYGGFDIGEETVRLDFTAGDVDPPNPLTIQRLANEAVWDSRDVRWYEMDAEEARGDEEIVFNLRDGDEDAETVRIVEIDGWDVAACGGTHVENTVEVGPIAVTEVSNPGADLVRVEYAVGSAAIDHWAELRRNAERAAERLDTGVADLPRRAESLLEENRSLVEERDELARKLLDAQVERLAADPLSVDGGEWLLGTVEGVGPNAVADRLGELDDDVADVAVLVGRDGSTFLVVWTDGSVDANDVIGDVTGEFGGGGGGQPTLAQGGGLDADPGDVLAYLRDW